MDEEDDDDSVNHPPSLPSQDASMDDDSEEVDVIEVNGVVHGGQQH